LCQLFNFLKLPFYIELYAIALSLDKCLVQKSSEKGKNKNGTTIRSTLVVSFAI
jgi:hypothetical protein